MEHFTLRRANSDDVDFIFRLRAQTMKEDFERTFGWNDDEQYKRAADEITQAQIIMIDDIPVGVIKVLNRDHEFHLHQMQILPHFQGKGIGTSLLSALLDRADNQNLPVSLFVLKGARAIKLYDRLGFTIIQENVGNYKMNRFPQTGEKRGNGD